jgi:hypothetical protein
LESVDRLPLVTSHKPSERCLTRDRLSLTIGNAHELENTTTTESTQQPRHKVSKRLPDVQNFFTTDTHHHGSSKARSLSRMRHPRLLIHSSHTTSVAAADPLYKSLYKRPHQSILRDSFVDPMDGHGDRLMVLSRHLHLPFPCWRTLGFQRICCDIE